MNLKMNLKARVGKLGKSVVHMELDFVQTLDVNDALFAVKRG